MNTRIFGVFFAAGLIATSVAQAQTGVSDDRVSLPEGPGSLEGVGENVDVDPNMGLMSYTLDIVVPAGFGPTTPNLDLSYSSGSGDSVVGVGWNMMMPSIERMTYRRLPSYTLDDDFAANGGDQLIKMPGTDPPVYRSRYESGFVRYTWHEAGDGGGGYWTSEQPDGSVGYYGADARGTLVPSSRATGPDGVFRYHLVSMVDVHGHEARYTYFKSGNYPLLTEIGWVFNAPDTPTYRALLEYEERRDETGAGYISDGAPGFNLLLTQRPRELRIEVRQQVVRRYELTYERYDAAGGFTRLKRLQQFGAQGTPYPVVHDFGYSQALGGDCEQDCNTPVMVDAGALGVNLQSGTANLIDINGDALPDVVDSTLDGAHRFFLNIADIDGTSHLEGGAIRSAIGTRSTHDLRSHLVQTLDVDGDGFTDLVNSGTGEVLMNRGNGDWETSEEGEVSALATALANDFDPVEGDFDTLRFLDYNNDKLIDVMRSNGVETSFLQNDGADGFTSVPGADNIGRAFDADNLDLADMNGDGLLDVVRVQVGGIQYRLNLGWGHWEDWVTILGLPIAQDADIELTSLEDLNGDGLADLVLVKGNSVTYALNNNSSSFRNAFVLTADDVEGSIPARGPQTVVLFADMNGNGSSDVVWVEGSNGKVDFLELFPVRPNLLTTVENGVGMVTRIEYGTAAQEMARDGGWTAWRYKIPYPMNVVKEISKSDLLTNVGEITRYDYHDGFYDGVEKQFRGFQKVESTLLGDASIEEGFTELQYDVGAVDPYFNGLLVSERKSSAGRVLTETSNGYADCDVAEISDGAEFPVRFVCPTSVDTVIKEGRTEAEWLSTRSTTEFDDTGNLTLEADLGVISQGGGPCAACDRDASTFGAPCGPTCRGDESFTETEYIGIDATDGRWILGATRRVLSYGSQGADLASETITYYDGPEFQGLPGAELTVGNPTRITQRVRVGSDEVIQAERNAYDEHGNVVESIDPNGDPDVHAHRRQYTYDEDGLRVARAEVLLMSPEGEPYRLRRDVIYEPLFDQTATATAWVRVVDGQVVSTERRTAYEYDEFGRMVARYLPGNVSQDPDETFEYDLQSPASRIITRRRAEVGQPMNIESIRCIDGRNREFQTRSRLASGLYQVTGFEVFNIQSKPVRVYQPYQGRSGVCDSAPPEGTRFTEYRYDALYREIEQKYADGDIYESQSVTQTVYGPLTSIRFDQEDSDQASPHVGTPLTTRMDGLNRPVAFERVLEAGGEPAVLEISYDGLGRLTGYTDAGGNTKVQEYDLLDRVVRILDPNTGDVTTFAYDDASNEIQMTDDRGVVSRTDYDGMNRTVAQWDEADPEGTRITQRYDYDPNCPLCTNGEGRVVTATYPGLFGERGVDHFGFDVRERPIWRQRVVAGVPFEVELGYDNADRLISTTWPDGRTVDEVQDDAARLTQVVGIVESITYDERDQMTAMTCADGTTEAMAYDDIMRLEELVTRSNGEILQGFRYTRDRMGNLGAVEDLAQAQIAHGSTFDYDAWYRVTGAAVPGQSLTYGHDRLDNLTTITSSLGEDSPAHRGAITYGDRPNAALSVGDTALGYDPAGYMTERGDREQTFDWMGRLTEVTGPTATTIAYETDQNRVAKIEGDSVTLYLYDNYEVRDGISTLYIKVDRHRVARIETDALATMVLGDPVEDGEVNAADAFASRDAEGVAPGSMLWSAARRLLVETGPADGVTFLHHDHLGSLTLATGRVGEETAVLGSRAFTPLGLVRDEVGYVDEYGFTGQELDAASGLLHFGWRYYDPDLGRWISVDPAFATSTSDDIGRLGESSTAYVYVAGNFINTYDPTGLGLMSLLKGKGWNGTKGKKAAKKSKSESSDSTPMTAAEERSAYEKANGLGAYAPGGEFHSGMSEREAYAAANGLDDGYFSRLGVSDFASATEVAKVVPEGPKRLPSSVALDHPSGWGAVDAVSARPSFSGALFESPLSPHEAQEFRALVLQFGQP